MTTTAHTTAANTAALDAFAEAAYDLELDLPTLYDTVRDTLTPADAHYLAGQLELCPMHGCDEQICDDDDIAECRALRNA